MRQTVDARGLVCPEPVIMTKKALDSCNVNEVLAIVDDPAALENISRMVKNMNLESMIQEQDGSFYINISKEELRPEKNNLRPGTVVLVKSNMLGQGNDDLGSTLMKSFMYSLTQLDEEINALIFLNSGVLLTTAGSELIEYIKQLEKNGVKVVSCETCLDFYDLTDKLAVGTIGNMYSITEALLQATKVIAL